MEILKYFAIIIALILLAKGEKRNLPQQRHQKSMGFKKFWHTSRI